jgi:hypothetical protein
MLAKRKRPSKLRTADCFAAWTWISSSFLRFLLLHRITAVSRYAILAVPAAASVRQYWKVMEIQIRAARLADLKHILHHRRSMFEEMGFRDGAVLDNVEDRSREYFGEALQNGM